MSQSLTLKIAGLATAINELSQVREGGLLVADNIDIATENLATPRRGFDRVSGGYGTNTDRTDKLWMYQDKVMSHNGTLGAADTISYLSSGAWSDLSGTFSAPSGYKLQTLEANQNLYITSSGGIYKLDTYSSTPILSGAYKALDISSSVSASASTWLANNYRTAYRVIWGYTDANNNLILGAPSQRESYKNTAGSTKAVDIRITIPSGVTTSWFVQVYRAAAVDNSSTDTEPSDEMGLVYETTPSAGNISAGYIDITDIVPDALRGATIYTAASQEGLANQNERPPLAKDIATFRDCTFYANTVSKHRYYLTLLAVSGSGLVADDTITIGGITYTGKASETIASAQFKVYTSGSAAQNIRDTALSLVRVINRYSSSTVYAYYLSGTDELPGKILLEERAIGGASFAVTASRGSAFNPSLPTSGTSESSTNDTYVNGLFWSKQNQPEAVPLGNFVEVGNRNKAIHRIIALKDSLLIFKEDGIYKLTGYYPSFNVDLLDSSAQIIGVETPAILNNTVFCLTTQGIVAVGDSVSVISLPIEDEIREKVANNQAGIESLAFGIAFEAERKYYLWLPNTSGSTYCESAFVFNSFTRAFTKHKINVTCGYISSDNNLYFGDATSNYLIKERRSYTYADYVDYGFSTSISAINGTIITLGSGIDNVRVGDLLYQSSTLYAAIESIDAPNSQLTINSDPGFTIASAFVHSAIDTKIRWVPITLGNPAVLKQFHTAEVILKADFQGTAQLGFETELSAGEEMVNVDGSEVGLWGYNWGYGWGGEPIRRPARQLIPRDKQRCSQLIVSYNHKRAYSAWKLSGISIFGEFGSEKVSKD